MRDDAALLTDFLEGELPPERRAEVERRLAAEPDLALALAEAEAVRRLLGGLSPAEAPADFARKTRRRLRRKRAFRPRAVVVERFGIEIFAVVAAVTMFAVYFFLEAEQSKALGPLRDVAPVTRGP